MYLSFYNLLRKPFTISADPRFLWRGEKHKEAFANLKYGLLDLNGYVVLTGDVGTGKTTLLNALIETLDGSVHIANVNHPTLETLDFFRIIANCYDPSVEISNKAEFLLFLNDFLQKSHAEGKVVLLIIDEAHRLSKEILEEIRLFSNIEQAGAKLINIFFVGQNEFNGIIELPECRALRQRITLFYDLEPLTRNETQEYVEHRLDIAGANGQLFTSEAIRRIYKFTKGYPRLINILCDRALLTGYVRGQREIDKAILKECIKDLKYHHVSEKAESPGKIERPKLMPIGLTGLVVLILIAAGMSMNYQPSLVGDNESAKPGTVAGEEHANLFVHQTEPSPKPAESKEQSLSEKNVEEITESGSETPERKTAKLVIGPTGEKQKFPAPAQPVEVLAKASTKQTQPTTDDLANQPVQQSSASPPQPIGNTEHSVSKNNVEWVMDNGPKTHEQETAKAAIGPVGEKQNSQVPLQPAEVLVKASTKQSQPTTGDLAYQPVQQSSASPPQPIGNTEHSVSKKNVEWNIDNGSKTHEQETAKAVIRPVEEKQNSPAPASPSNVLVKASIKQPQPTTFDLAAAAIEQENYLLAIDLLETYGNSTVGNDSSSRELYAKAIVGRAEQIGISPETGAETMLQKAVEVNQNNRDAHFDLGKLYTQSKDYSLAIASYKDAIRLDPGLTDAFFNLGYIHATIGKYLEAEEYFAHVIQLAPKYLDKALVNLALIQEKLGKREESLANLHKAVVRNPGNEKAQNYLKKLLASMEVNQQ